MAEELLRVWDNFDGGLGQAKDRGSNELYSIRDNFTTPALVGYNGVLMSSGLETALSQAVTSGYIFLHAIHDLSSTLHVVYLFCTNGTNTEIYKYSGENATNWAARGTITLTNIAAGRPEKYQGSWYFTGTNDHATARLMHKLAITGAADIIAGDVTTGDANSGDGDLLMLGHQLSKIQRASGISILATAADPLVDANWGSDFPSGDSSEQLLGAASVEGLSFVLRSPGVYSYNDRGRAGLVTDDLVPWRTAATTSVAWSATSWKTGIVFSHPSGLYFYRPGQPLLPIGMERKFSSKYYNDAALLGRAIPKAVQGVGEFLYVSYAVPTHTGSSYVNVIACATSLDGTPYNLSWTIIDIGSSTSYSRGLAVLLGVTPNSSGDASLVFQEDATTLKHKPLGPRGAPAGVYIGAAIKAVTGSHVYLPELTFSPPLATARLRVYLVNMDSGSSYQMRVSINGAILSTLPNIGGPLGANSTVYDVPINYPAHISTLVISPQLTYDASATTYTNGAISRIELWGTKVSLG